MTGLLEVVVLNAADAERAEAGGADRLELTSSLADGMSPEPALVGQVRRATSLPIRVMLRLRQSYTTDGGEVARLKGLLSSYLAVGANGVVLGFLNGHTASIQFFPGPSTAPSMPVCPAIALGASCVCCLASTKY